MRVCNLIFIAAVSVAVAVFSATSAAQSKSSKSSTSQKMFDELAVKDGELFDAVFNTCNLDKLRELVTEDFEFYHDRWGQIAKSEAEFVDAIRGVCERQKKGLDSRARRELVKNVVQVYPINNYGAIQTGAHRFYKIAEAKEDELTETAQFTHLWKKDNGEWKLARVLSYDHRDPKGKALADRVVKKTGDATLSDFGSHYPPNP